MTTPSTNASLVPPALAVAADQFVAHIRLADLVDQFPLHSEWENASGARRTVVGYGRKTTTILFEASGECPVRVPVEDARATYTRVRPAPPCPITEVTTLSARPLGGRTVWSAVAIFAHDPQITLHPPDATPKVDPGQYGIYTWGGAA